jgi:hypothetical protein
MYSGINLGMFRRGGVLIILSVSLLPIKGQRISEKLPIHTRPLETASKLVA